MSKYKNVMFVIVGILGFILVCAGLYYLAFYDNRDYYSMIDNSKYIEVDNDYKYTLEFYDEDGKSKEISFETSRELRDGAYIKVNYMRLRGVTSWEEVQLEEMPSKVKSKYE